MAAAESLARPHSQRSEAGVGAGVGAGEGEAGRSMPNVQPEQRLDLRVACTLGDRLLIVALRYGLYQTDYNRIAIPMG